MRSSTCLLALAVVAGLLPGCGLFMSTGNAGRRSGYVETFRHDADGHTHLATEPTDGDADRSESTVSPTEDADASGSHHVSED
jgi:hypothetical protein